MASESAEPSMQDQFSQANKMAQTYKALRDALGVDHTVTLNVLFNYFNELIKLYKLTECDELLTEGYDACMKRGKQDEFYLKMIQALAFLRFKQFKFKESVKLFEEMREIIGPNASLLENLGHAYNSLGDQTSAEKCFTEALEIAEKEDKEKEEKGEAVSFGARAGLLLGLGLVKCRRDKPLDGLPLLQKALQCYIKQYDGKDHSLQAKARTSIAGALETLGRFKEAEDEYVEAVRVFKLTCGEDSPLTVEALRKLGFVLFAQKKIQEAYDILREAAERTGRMDKHSINLNTLSTIIITLFELHKILAKTKEMPKWELPPLPVELIQQLLFHGNPSPE